MSQTEFYPELDTALRTYLQAAFDWLREHHQHEHLYAVGLGMVEDICGFFIVGNTLERLADLSHGLKDTSEANKTGYFWSISEWKSEEFLGLRNLVGQVVADIAHPLSIDDDAYDAFRLVYQDHILNVLADMRGQGLLQNAQSEELWVWVQYADAYDEDFDDVSFARLNPPELSHLFSLRYEPNKHNLTHVLHERLQTLPH